MRSWRLSTWLFVGTSAFWVGLAILFIVIFSGPCSYEFCVSPAIVASFALGWIIVFGPIWLLTRIWSDRSKRRH